MGALANWFICFARMVHCGSKKSRGMGSHFSGGNDKRKGSDAWYLTLALLSKGKDSILDFLPLAISSWETRS